MNLTSILIIVWYTVQPLLWLVLLALAVLLTAQLTARMKGYRIGRQSKGLAAIISLLMGFGAVFVAPLATRSSLTYVTTGFDWLALFLVAIGVVIYSWLVIHPVLYLVHPSHSAAHAQSSGNSNRLDSN